MWRGRSSTDAAPVALVAPSAGSVDTTGNARCCTLVYTNPDGVPDLADLINANVENCPFDFTEGMTITSHTLSTKLG
jgi:hypothetical protein